MFCRRPMHFLECCHYFCVALDAYQHIGITLSHVCLSVCLSVLHSHFLGSRAYLFCRWHMHSLECHHYFCHICIMMFMFKIKLIVLKIILWRCHWYCNLLASRDECPGSLCHSPSVGVGVRVRVGCVDKNFNLGHNFQTSRGRALILHMCIPCDKTFHMVP